MAAFGRRDELAVSGRTRSGALIWPDESPDALTIYEPVGPAEGRTIDRAHLVAGRRPDPRRPNEVLVDRAAARILGYGVGDRFQLRFATARFIAWGDAHDIPYDFRADPKTYASGPLIRLRIVGVASSVDGRWVELSPGFQAAYGRDHLQAWVREDSFALRRKAADIAAFHAGVDRIAAGSGFDFFDDSSIRGVVQRSVDVQTRAVWLVSIIGALATFALAMILLLRPSASDSDDWRTFRALGMRRSQFARIGAGHGAVVGVAAAGIAVVIAAALSWMFPLGAAHSMEPSPGISVDSTAAVGVIALVGICSTLAALGAWLLSGRGGRVIGPRFLGDHIRPHIRRLPLTAGAGVRLMLGRGGMGSVSLRFTLAGAIAAVTTISAAAVFSASVTHLLETPRLYGQNWDLEIGQGGAPRPIEEAALRASPLVGAFATGATATSILVDGHQVGVQAMGSGKGNVTPTVASGRAPAAADEIMLAPGTLRTVGARVGETVIVQRGSRRERMRVVGAGILPPSTTNDLGGGAAMTLQGLKRVIPTTFWSLFRVRLAHGVDRGSALSRLESRYEAFDPVAPDKVADLARTRVVPYAIAAVAVLVGVVALIHLLAASIRDRGRDLAVMKAIGLRRSQVMATVLWQSVSVSVAGLVVGLPLGIAVGRWAWTIAAEDLGVLQVTVIPVVPLAATIPAALLVAAVAALAPAGRAARTQAAQALRAE